LKKTITYIRLGILLLSLGYFAYTVFWNNIKHSKLTTMSPRIEAVIINEKNFFGNSPVSHDFSYSYRFKIDGKVYKGDSMNSKYGIGEVILVRYDQSDPNINEPVISVR